MPVVQPSTATGVASAQRAAWSLTVVLGGCSPVAAQELRTTLAGTPASELGQGTAFPGETALPGQLGPVVFGPQHDRVRRSLGNSPVARVRLGRRGRSVKFKLTLEDGTVAQFKPEQTFAAHWYSELAAYYIDRALGLGRVPPTIGRRLQWSQLRRAASRSLHRDEMVAAKDGTVRGSLTWWVPTKLVALDPPAGWEAWLSADGPPTVSPFQWRSRYRRALAKGGADERRADITPPPPAFADRPAELSDLILFDYLIGNLDRWGSNFTNVRTLGPGGPLVFIDNANGFHTGRQPDEQSRAQLAAVQRMRRTTVDALEKLDVEELRRILALDPLAPVLSKRHLEDLEQRRQEILDHVERMRARLGEGATPW